MADQNDFAERLKRFQSPQAPLSTVEPTRVKSAGSGGGGHGVGKRPNAGGAPNPDRAFALLIGGVLLFFGVAAALLTAADVRDPFTTEIANAMQADGGSERSPGLIAALVERGKPMPIDYLPTATAGWIRVTAADATADEALAKIAARWPLASGDEAWFPLHENLGFKRLERFLSLHAKSDLEQQVIAEKRAHAIYLGTGGEFFEVTLEFHDKVRALGPPDAPRPG